MASTTADTGGFATSPDTISNTSSGLSLDSAANEIPELTSNNASHLEVIRHRLTFICLIISFAVLYVARDFFMPMER